MEGMSGVKEEVQGIDKGMVVGAQAVSWSLRTI
jgi:hypothetical protein